MELLHSLGIDWKLLIAQLVNFVILLAVLYKFLYKPMLKLMQERTIRIEKGLQDANEAEKKLTQSAAEYQKIVNDAERQGQLVLGQSKAHAEQLRASLIKQTQDEAAKMLEAGRATLKREHEEMMQAARKELMQLVVSASRVTLGEVVTEELDKKIVEAATKALHKG